MLCNFSFHLHFLSLASTFKLLLHVHFLNDFLWLIMFFKLSFVVISIQVKLIYLQTEMFFSQLTASLWNKETKEHREETLNDTNIKQL